MILIDDCASEYAMRSLLQELTGEMVAPERQLVIMERRRWKLRENRGMVR